MEDDDLETGPGPPVTTTTVTDRELINDDVDRLRAENLRLSGKLRGYLTLNQLFQEAKEECRKLQQENKQLVGKCLSQENSEKRSENNDFSESAQTGETSGQKETDENNRKPASQIFPSVTKISINSSVPSSTMFGSGKKNFESTEQPTNPPNQQSEPHLIDIEEKQNLDQIIPESTPMQESLSDQIPFQPPVSTAIPVSEASLTGSVSGIVTSPYALEENVTFDSDIVDEEELIKLQTRHKPAMSSGNAPPSAGVMSLGSAYIGFGEDFSTSTQRQSEYGYYQRPSYPYQIPQTRETIFSSNHSTANSEHLGGSPTSFHVAGDLTNMVDKIVRLEQSERGWKALAETLQTDISSLKSKFSVFTQDKDSSAGLLKTENLMLLKKIKKLEHERDALSPGDSVSSETQLMGTGWVHVEKQQGQSSSSDTVNAVDETEYSALVRRVRFLEQKNKELNQANKEWEDYRRKSEVEQHGKMCDLRSRLEASERNLMEFRIHDEKRQREIDKILLASKSRCHALEEEKEELAAQLDDSRTRCSILEGRIRDMEKNFTDLNRELQTSRTEAHTGVPMNQLSETPLSGNMTTQSTAVQSSRDYQRNVEELRNEKEALKQQLTIFQEDFDRERADRAKAQSEKDDLQRTIGELSKQTKHSSVQKKNAEDTLRSTLSENEQLQTQLADMQRQLRSAEETLRKTLDENERLQRQVRDFKMKQARRPEAVLTTPPAMPTGQLFYPPQHGLPQQHQQPQPVWTNAQGQRTVYQQAQPTLELLPGSWQCSACTLVNYRGRTVCEACGNIQQQQQQQRSVQTGMQHPPSPREQFPNPNVVGMPYYSGDSPQQPMVMYQQQNHPMYQNLVPRGGIRLNQGRPNPGRPNHDLTSDNGEFHM